MADEAAAPNPEAEQPAAEAVPKTPKKIVPLAALGGGMLLGAALGLFLIGPKFTGSPETGADSTHAEAAAAGAEGGHAAESGEGGESSPSRLHVIDNLILNPAGSGGARFLMVTTAVELSADALVNELKARDIEARDVVLRVLGGKTVEDLADMANRERFKGELRDSLSALFAGSQRTTAIRRIYFPHFVIQ